MSNIDFIISKMRDMTTNICESHSLEHMCIVYDHACEAVKELDISEDKKNAIKLAALLHDIDDRKFFKTVDYANARMLLRESGNEDFEKLVIKMISLVSASSNRNEVPEECIENSWMLIPRIADRIEAIGEIGIYRCLKYTVTINRPFFTDNTMRATTIDELNMIASEERYAKYDGTSVSAIDHMYDKLLHICKNKCNNKYLDKLIDERNSIMIDYCLHFGKHGSLKYNPLAY